MQSYLAWLTDSDFDPNCALCEAPLNERETVRLQCLRKRTVFVFEKNLADLFHWECLDGWASAHPANTAPAGFRCPTCREAVFPAPNQTSPMIDKLRSQLQRANWARAGLGLPLVIHSSISSPTSFSFRSSTTLILLRLLDL